MVIKILIMSCCKRTRKYEEGYCRWKKTFQKFVKTIKGRDCDDFESYLCNWQKKYFIN